MAQKEKVKAAHEKKQKPPAAGRGGARAGAGRKSGSGAFGEATVPMRVPVSLEQELDHILESFKNNVAVKKDCAQKVAPLSTKALRDKAAELVELAGKSPSGKPVDVLRILASRPESCYAWRALDDHAEWGIRSGDTVVIDRSAKPAHGCLGAFWSGDEVELMAVEIGEGGAKARRAGSKKFELQADSLSDLQVWGIVVGIARKISSLA